MTCPYCQTDLMKWGDEGDLWGCPNEGCFLYELPVTPEMNHTWHLGMRGIPASRDELVAWVLE